MFKNSDLGASSVNQKLIKVEIVAISLFLTEIGHDICKKNHENGLLEKIQDLNLCFFLMFSHNQKRFKVVIYIFFLFSTITTRYYNQILKRRKFVHFILKTKLEHDFFT